LPHNRGGVGLTTFKHIAMKLRLTKRHALRTSQHETVRDVWKESSTRYVETDSLLLSSSSLRLAAKTLKENNVEKAASQLHSLHCQEILTKSVSDYCPKKT